MGVWAEIGLALGLITLATLLTSSGLVWIVTQRAQGEAQAELAVAASDTIADQLTAVGTLAEVVSSMQRGLKRVEIAAFDIDGHSLTNDLPAAPWMQQPIVRTLKSRSQTIEQREGEVFVFTPMPAGAARYALVVSTTVDNPGLSARSLAVLGGYTLFAAGIIAAFGAVLLRRGLVKPLLTVQSASRRLAEGTFGDDIALEGGAEFQDLAHSLTTLSHALEEYRRDQETRLEELQRAYDDLNAAKDHLVRSERLATVGRLAAGIAHEVGNPLAAVSGFVDLLLLGVDDEAQRTELLERAQREITRINGILRQLLDYARIEQQGADTFDLTALAREAIDTTAAVPRMRAVRVTLEAGEAAMVHADRHRVHQVVVNLLLNAADAVCDVKEPWVRLTVEVADHHVVLRCRDNGPGFASEALERATEPFFTTKEVGAGTGLGLFVSRQVVEAVGGQLVWSNAEDGGAILEIRFPRQ